MAEVIPAELTAVEREQPAVPPVPTDDVEMPVAGPSKPARRPQEDKPLEPLDEILFKRLNVIREGDNVLLRLPSDAIKAVVASKTGYVGFELAMQRC